jgi:S1-C subfamily serine protease
MRERRRPAGRLPARVLTAGAGVALAAALSGCAGLAAKPPDEEATKPPPVHRVSTRVVIAASRPVPTLISQSLRRKAERLVVRVRNVNCLGLGTGSGFALDEHTLVTNRHVLAGAERVEVSTWDGHTLRASTGKVGALVDMGIAPVEGTLPSAGAVYADPRADSRIAVVGFPGGGPLTFSGGRILDFIDGSLYGIPGRIMRLTAQIEPGSSGSPVLDDRGRVVGIVYAIELSTGLALAIPVGTLRALVDRGGYEPIPSCGSE